MSQYLLIFDRVALWKTILSVEDCPRGLRERFADYHFLAYHKSMEFHDEILVQKARQLRKSGQSLNKIACELGLNDRTIRRWCIDIPSKNSSYTNAYQQREDIKLKSFKNLGTLKIDSKLAKILCSTLYWAEGTKYPGSVAISFSNSDPAMLLFFIRLLRLSFTIKEEKFRVHLQLHSNQNINDLQKFWSNLLQIPVQRFWKPTITKPTKKMKRQNYMGTCTLRYHDYKILLELTGIFENLPKLWKGG